MTTWGILLGPLIVAVVVGCVICICAIIALCSLMEERHSRVVEARTRATLLSETYRKTILLCHQQDDAISAIITEIETSPATYHAMLPASIRDSIYDAHSKMQQIQREGKI